MLAGLVGETITTKGPAYPWGNTITTLSKADLRIANLECPISEQGTKWKPKLFNFRASPRAVDSLKAAGIDCVSLANNHILDYGVDAMADTIRLLDQAGIAHSGAGGNRTQAMTPAFLTAKNLTVGFVSMTDNMPVWKATETKAGVNHVPLWSMPDFLKAVRLKYVLRPALDFIAEVRVGHRWREIISCLERSISLARSADFTVLSCNCGPNWRTKPYHMFQKFSRIAIEFGFDMIHGHSAHVFQGVGVWKNKPILFDTGDFIEDYPITRFRNDLSFIFMLDVSSKTKKPEKITLIPTYISKCQTNLAPDHLADMICSKMQKRCAKMGTKTRRDGKNLIIELAG